MTANVNAKLQSEVNELGHLFGAIIARFAGQESFDLVERVRLLTREMRSGDEAAGTELRELLASVDETHLKYLIRSYTLFLELINLAEDRQRIRVLRQRDQQAYPEPRRESIRQAISRLSQAGLDNAEMQDLLGRVCVELVLTAHPTEAKRRTTRRLLRQFRQTLTERDQEMPETEAWDRHLRYLESCLELLWHTDLIRSRRPTVLQEVKRGLDFLPNLWQQVPEILRDLREALAEYYPEVSAEAGTPIRFGSWIGGDRDGNPFVTATVTEQTLGLLRRNALEAHLETCRQLVGVLSFSDRQTRPFQPLTAALAGALRDYPQIMELMEGIPPDEEIRRWLRVIQWRLLQSLAVGFAHGSCQSAVAGVYEGSDALLADVRLLADAVRDANCLNVLGAKVLPWIDQIRVFGLHLARLDIRQHSGVHRAVIDEIWEKTGAGADPSALDEPSRMELLAKTYGGRLPPLEWSETTQEVFSVFTVIRRAARQFGMEAIGEHIVSMTSRASDVFSVLWLWKWSESVDGGHSEDANLRLPVVPLFETIDDLRHSTSILREMLGNEIYRAHLSALGDMQTVMIGYSDSTKDGGYLSAQWSLYRAQTQLYRVAQEFGVMVDFFHGRGGSLGRGGGPAARSILSLPAEAFFGSLRLTEQGEVLAERYDNPAIAFRHFEQIISSTLVAASPRTQRTDPAWHEVLDRLDELSLGAYRRLVEHPAFGDFFRYATPISLIERLPIGSRPSKRKASNRIEDLRAIPWVFSWTQNRCLLPAWYGMGEAFEELIAEDPAAREVLAAAYDSWPFLRSTIDNAELALAKANMPVFKLYCRSAQNRPGVSELVEMVVAEHRRACRAVTAISGKQDLLEGVPWLRQSIHYRNGYVDPLNLMQVELIERAARLEGQLSPEASDRLERLLSLSVKGVAAGMRTTG